jgi:hypothetical protein
MVMTYVTTAEDSCVKAKKEQTCFKWDDRKKISSACEMHSKIVSCADGEAMLCCPKNHGMVLKIRK